MRKVSIEAAIAKHIELLNRGAYLHESEVMHAEVGRAFLKALGIRLYPSPSAERRFCDREMKSVPNRPAEVPAPGFVYLMRNNRNQHVKIGWSTNPKVREGTLQSEEPDVELVASAPGTRELEADLHRKFDMYRVRGEWFALSASAVVALMSEVFRAV